MGKAKAPVGPPKIKPDGLTIEILKDQYVLGRQLGVGGFGLIYEDRKTWMAKRKLKHFPLAYTLGMGTVTLCKLSCRVMVLPRYGPSLNDVMDQHRNTAHKLSAGTVALIASQVTEALAYLHSHDYVHSDIKGANICTSLGNNHDIILIDFGCAERFRSMHLCRFSQQGVTRDGHKPYLIDPTLRHEGTLPFTCLDMHQGALCTRRGDLEIFAYQCLHCLKKAVFCLSSQLDNGKAAQRNADELHHGRYELAKNVNIATDKKTPQQVQDMKMKFFPRAGEAGLPGAKAKRGATELAQACGITDPQVLGAIAPMLEQVFALGYSEEPKYAKFAAVLAKCAAKTLDLSGPSQGASEAPAAGKAKSASSRSRAKTTSREAAAPATASSSPPPSATPAAAKRGTAHTGGRPTSKISVQAAEQEPASGGDSPRTLRLLRRHERMKKLIADGKA
ncbi:uncharacterized protein MONBRDRAFT_29391 [Monosiga brevicollis MX1]|uniref:non-specific serine/threonine protein kinase n=1 Tax=Monosiga brevicollis TaxID=81824 RepID=A9VAY6_MONBE|nr:uncharacterized protein MONBRDRAFT_29391 [Monosiga brevicollis MX1]EDQ85245.1 predicted protein [Monosiga brevicollis MX1]|eukprot:XP_001749866.1 hypothetical protein [Monosiga brevicollis MX1]